MNFKLFFKIKNIIIVSIIILLLFPSYLFAENNDDLLEDSLQTEYAKGKIIKILEEKKGLEYSPGMLTDNQLLEVKILSGPYKDTVIKVENSTTGNPAFDLWFSEGDQVLLVLETLTGEVLNGYAVDFVRDKYIAFLVILFLLLLVILGKKQGVKSVITLFLTVLIIGKFMLPQLFQGHSPVFLALISGFLVTALTLFIIGGFSRKSVAAITGTFGGLLFAAVLAIIVGKLTNLKGLSGEEAQMLMFIPQEIDFDYRGLLFAGIIIGALGAVMDVSMSIASAMEEIKNAASQMTLKDLINSGMNVGKDIMGTMSNTLILAYTGTSIPLLLLFMAYEQPFIKLINMDFLAAEIIRALTGSIGLLMSIPITAITAGILMVNNNNSSNNDV